MFLTEKNTLHCNINTFFRSVQNLKSTEIKKECNTCFILLKCLFSQIIANNSIKYFRERSGEWTKASVTTCTVVGSNLGHGRHFSSDSHGVRREDAIPPARAWQIPMGVHLKILPNTKNVFLRPFPYVPIKTLQHHPTAHVLSCRV